MPLKRYIRINGLPKMRLAATVPWSLTLSVRNIDTVVFKYERSRLMRTTVTYNRHAATLLPSRVRLCQVRVRQLHLEGSE